MNEVRAYEEYRSRHSLVLQIFPYYLGTGVIVWDVASVRSEDFCPVRLRTFASCFMFSVF